MIKGENMPGWVKCLGGEQPFSKRSHTDMAHSFGHICYLKNADIHLKQQKFTQAWNCGSIKKNLQIWTFPSQIDQQHLTLLQVLYLQCWSPKGNAIEIYQQISQGESTKNLQWFKVVFHNGGIHLFKGKQMLEASYFEILKSRSSVFWRDEKSPLQPVCIICGALVSRSKIEKTYPEIVWKWNQVKLQFDSHTVESNIKCQKKNPRGNLTMVSCIWKD